MRKFNVSCKDSVTGMELILSECTFNQACYYLQGQPLGKYLGCESVSINCTKIKFEKRQFIYDEIRGYLMGM